MNLLRSFSVYTIAAFLTQAINFLLLPLFTNYLSPGDFGILSLITTFATFLSPLILLSIDGAISIEFYKNEFSDLRTYISSAIAISVIAASVILLIVLVLSSWLSVIFGIPRIWLIVTPIFGLLETFKIINLLLFQVQKKATQYALYSISSTLLNISLALFFVIVLKYNYAGRMYSQYIASILFFMLACYYLTRNKYLTIKINRKMMHDALAYGTPLVLHSLGFIIINLADRLFVSHYHGNTALGIYSLAYTIGSLISIVALAFTNAWTPHLFELLKENTSASKQRIVKVIYLFIGGLFLSTLVLIVMTRPVFRLFIGPKFYAGADIVPWIAFSSFFFGCYLAFTNLIFYLKKNRIFGIAAVINIFVNLVLNFMLIPQLGIIGAAYATFISFLIFALIISTIAIRAFPQLPWLNLKKEP